MITRTWFFSVSPLRSVPSHLSLFSERLFPPWERDNSYPLRVKPCGKVHRLSTKTLNKHPIAFCCHTGLDQSLEMVECDVLIRLGLDCELHPRVPGLRREGMGLQEKAGFGYQKRVTWMLSGQTQMFSVLGNYFKETNGTSFRFLVHIPLSCHGPRRIEYPSSCHANSF